MSAVRFHDFQSFLELQSVLHALGVGVSGFSPFSLEPITAAGHHPKVLVGLTEARAWQGE
ncbi:rCG25087 [Rattus norvegicus]|uniref:RCG25087 n=1 Tax=Rattus norvegicus TaxID=10116 RepID=A6I3M0_RAT|nr:rCG25087 [Rattus norvegicus]